jgi:hypothetical protein
MHQLYAQSELHLAGIEYTLSACDSAITRMFRQAQLSSAINTSVHEGNIQEVEVLLGCFTTAWLKRWSQTDITSRQCVDMKRAFTHVINSVIEAMLRNGVLAMLTPPEMNQLYKDLNIACAYKVSKCYEIDCPVSIDSLLNILYSTARVPRLNIRVVQVYAHVITCPGDPPWLANPNQLKVPAPNKDIVSVFTLTYLNPHLVRLAEQKSPNDLINHLKGVDMLAMFDNQLRWLYTIILHFHTKSILRLAYCTAIVYRATPWVSRTVWPDITKGQRDPPSVADQDGLKHQRYVTLFNTIESNETNISNVKIMGHSVCKMELFLGMPLLSAYSRKRKHGESKHGESRSQ